MKIRSKIVQFNNRRKFKKEIDFSISKDGFVFAKQVALDIGYHFPYMDVASFDYRQMHNLYYGYHTWLLDKYTEGDVQIRSTDTVIDCGAFVGGFSIAAVKSDAKQIIAIEPSSKNFQCLQLNLEHYDALLKVIPLNIALGNKPATMELNLSKSGCDDSLLAPDEGSLFKSELVIVKTLYNLMEEQQLDDNHVYLKVEAEGFEPEIIEGLGTRKPRVVSVDVTPERDGNSPRELIHHLLTQFGYKNIIHTKRCLFAYI